GYKNGADAYLSKPFEINGTVQDGQEYKWITPLGKELQGAVITGDSIGTYKLTVTNLLGCVSIDSISVIANSNVQPFFASPSLAPVNKEVVFVDLTSPVASSIEWKLPATATLIAQTDFNLNLRFTETGTFKIRLLATVADCIYSFSKNITIVETIDDGEFLPPVGSDNLDFTILSNPIVNGVIGLKLEPDHPRTFTVTIMSIQGTKTAYSERFENFKDTKLYIPLPVNILSSTSYLLILENEFTRKAKRIIIHK
ncbi:MAG: hypothetical protein NWP83_00025, partial [Spirosomaceae bacterium]|nr:hypothetical protein [Spirosomataceae bacterium]